MKPGKRVALYVLAAVMTTVGIDHFVNPEPFERIVPGYLPSPHALVMVRASSRCSAAPGCWCRRPDGWRPGV